MAGIDNFQQQLMEYLEDYTEEIREGIDQVAKKNAQLGAKKLKKTGPLRTGEYRKGWGVVKKRGAYIIRNKKYQLTHLLEKGHAKANGTGRVEGEPHIGPVEKEVTKKFLNDVMDVISK